jgi:SAM-dependent methyltransferase
MTEQAQARIAAVQAPAGEGVRGTADIVPVLSRIAADYPPVLGASRHVLRNAFHLGLLAGLPRGARVCDIGGGLGPFSPGCAALGFDAVLVDDFKDAWHGDYAEQVLARIHRPLGVTVISRDVVADGVDFAPESLDAVTVFDTMEHWHNSPRPVFHALMRALKPGGTFVIGGPNCVNLRKRITVPFGFGKWSGMREWYEAERFRSHVREPDVADLKYIARDLGLRDVRILGRNWLGYHSRFRLVRALTPIGDRLLRLRPSLCSDIYMVGRKPG